MDDLFDRSVETLIESWAYLASGSPGAELIRVEGAAIAVFVHRPDREFLNNVVLAWQPRDLEATIGEIEVTYAGRGVGRYAIWVHESDRATAAWLRERGFRHDTSTRTMAMPTRALVEDDLGPLDVVEPGLEEFWAVDGDLEGFVPTLDPAGAHFYVARLDGKGVAMLMALDHAGDCGIFIVGTVEAARRRGIATALSAHAVREARARGCTTTSLQSTQMAERVYARVGFRDLGLWEEYVRAGPAEAA